MQIIESVRQRVRDIDRGLSRHAWYRIWRNAIVGMGRRDAQRKAAAITYFAIFSIFPLIMLLIVILSFFIDSKEAQDQVISLLSQFLPIGTVGVQKLIESVVSSRGTAAGFGIVLLAWGALGWFELIDKSINEMWVVNRTRPFVKETAFALSMIASLGLVMVLSWVANIIAAVALSFAINIIGGSAVVWELAIELIVLVLMFVVFLLLYRFSPLCNLRWRDVWRGALITAVIWTLFRSGFAIYITYFADYSSAFGPIAAVIIFLVWLYFAHNIILFGAILTYSMRLESYGIHELRDLECGLLEENER